MTGVILQVRIDSTRLPGKALLDLKGKTVVEHAMEALRGIPSAERFILATDTDSAELLAEKALSGGFELFVGPKNDVLKRYADAVRSFKLDRIVRATGDNPLVSADLAEKTLLLQETNDADYAACLGTPLGTGVEVVAARALLTADRNSVDPYEREHVCPYLYRRPEEFRICRPVLDGPWSFPDGKVTLDTLDDYRYIAGIFNALYREHPVGLDELVTWLKSSSRRAAASESEGKGERTEEENSGYPFGKTG